MCEWCKSLVPARIIRVGKFYDQSIPAIHASSFTVLSFR